MNIHDNANDIRAWHLVPQPSYVSLLFAYESNEVLIPILGIVDTGHHVGWVGMNGDIVTAPMEEKRVGLGNIIEIEFRTGPNQ